MDMNGKRREKLERMLSGGEVPEPPAGLLEKIKNEIPAQLPRAAATGEAAAPRWWGWRLAASLFLLIGFGYLAFRVGQTYEFSEAENLAAPHREVPTAVAPKETANDIPPAAPAQATVKAQDAPRKATRGTFEEERKLERDRIGARRTDAIATDALYALPPPPGEPAVALPRAASSIGMETARPERRAQSRDEAQKSADTRGRSAGGVVGGVIGGITGQSVRESITVTSEPALSKVPAPAAPPSTGGTAEPNGQPYGDVFFKHYGVNPFIDTEDDQLSTFGLEVDTASYNVARRYLLEGHLPPPEAIRPEEFLNAFDYGDAPPARGDFAIHVQGGESPFPRGPRYSMLRFGIRSRTIAAASRAPAVLTFVVDTSGSMERQNRLQLVKQALAMLLGQLREDDDVGLVVFSNEATVLLEPTGDHEAIREAIARLRPTGSTNAAAGLRLGYEVATDAFRRGANNRVVFLSDGVANVGTTRAEDILQQVERFKNRGILLNSVGVGMGNFNDELLEQIADKGNGTYAYIDDLEEAHRLFVENLTGTLQTVAEDARVQVEFNPRTVQSYRLIGYENRDIADQRFRDDTTDAGEIGAGHGVTALYEIKLEEGVRPSDVLATLTLRYRPSDSSRYREETRTVRVSEVAGRWLPSSRGFQLATLVATFAEMLRESHWAKHVDPDLLVTRLEALSARSRRDSRIGELLSLARSAADLQRPAVEE